MNRTNPYGWLCKNRQTKKYALIIDALVIFSAAAFFYILVLSFTPLIRRIVEDVGIVLVGFSIFITLIVLSVSVFLFALWNYVHEHYNVWMPTQWLYYTFVIMFIFLVLGSFFINHYYGTQPLSLNLRDSENSLSVWGNISCEGVSGKIVAEQLVFCKIDPTLQNVSGSLQIRMNNGSLVNYDFSSLMFMAPLNSNYLKFQIEGYRNGTLKKVEIGYPYRFYSEDELAFRNDKYISYFIFLVAGVLFSVPVMMTNFRKLSKT